MKLLGLNKAEVLVALYNRAKTHGLGILNTDPNYVMNIEKATELLQTQQYFDYLNGKVLKINLSGDDIDTWGYNRDNGQNAAEEVLQPLIERHKEKCTPKSLKSMCANVVIENKKFFFFKLHKITPDICDQFPTLEVVQ